MAKKKETRERVTRGEAIKKLCAECMNYQTHMVRKCPDKPCPLWTYRNGVEEECDTPIRGKG